MNEDWSGWSDLPWNELEGSIENVLTPELSTDRVEALTDIILQRMAVSLRKASRDQLLSEAKGLARLRQLAEAVGQTQLASVLDTSGRGIALAATRSDETAIEALLRSYQKHGFRMLEYIASNGEDAIVERKRIREYLGIDPKNDSHLSHMLKDFEKCGVILRVPGKGGVGVALDIEGKELVKSKLRPDWLPELVELIESQGAFRSKQEIVSRLIRTGFTSTQAASEIATAFQVARYAIDLRLAHAEETLAKYQSSQFRRENSVLNYGRVTAPLMPFEDSGNHLRPYARPAHYRRRALRNNIHKEQMR